MIWRGAKRSRSSIGYIARVGQQYGPLSDLEMTKFYDLGHLLVDDLLWRDGFPDWRPAGEVFKIATSRSTGP
jgi:hypothetical protein